MWRATSVMSCWKFTKLHYDQNLSTLAIKSYCTNYSGRYFPATVYLAVSLCVLTLSVEWQEGRQACPTLVFQLLPVLL